MIIDMTKTVQAAVGEFRERSSVWNQIYLVRGPFEISKYSNQVMVDCKNVRITDTLRILGDVIDIK